MFSEVSFNEKVIKNFNTPYIIAEIGANHNGNMELAKKTIDKAKECGADAVKFQSWDSESLICEAEYNANQKYDDNPKKHFGSLKEMVDKYYLRKDQHFELAEYCKKLDITFCSTPFSKKEVDLLIEINVPFLKIASMDIDNIDLLEYAAKTMKPVILSTGMATIEEIDRAVKVIEQAGNTQIVILHCVSLYPPDNSEVNLNNIKMLQKVYQYPIGFSDHTFGTSVPIASVALGACLIEKHFTLDKNMEGWDHEISADPVELKYICEESKKITECLGEYRRVRSDRELEKLKKFRRCIVSARDISKSEVLTKGDLLYKRPGTGIKPYEYPYLIGRKVNRDLKKDEIIKWEDLI
ncbi:MAG: N-acetylneuraminate synthase family protein [Candidatus Muiribacteriota bacterium]